MTSNMRRTAVAALLAALVATPVLAQTKLISLPPPDKTGGRPLLEVLQDRQSQREFKAGAPLPLQTVSTLLWAAFGITRPDGRRTAPSASNRQEIDLYVAMPDGLYVYDAKPHALRRVLSEDLRAATGTQALAAEAPLDLVYVADLSKMTTATDNQLAWAFADTAFIAENVYLYCASERLATVVRASVDRAALGQRMQLRPGQRIILAQSVGYPRTSPTTTVR
jgi:nitroreductase